MSSSAAIDKVVLWIEEDASNHGGLDPYAVAYRNADHFGVSLDQIDIIVREHCGIAAADPRRLRFLLWSRLDASVRSGHSAVHAKELLAWLRERSGCSREAATTALRSLINEDAVTGASVGDAKFVQMCAYARAEADAAAWVVERLQRNVNKVRT